VLSILLLIRRAARPRVIEVGRVPGTSYFADLIRHPENARVPGALVVRPEGSLVYFNVDHVRDRVTWSDRTRRWQSPEGAKHLRYAHVHAGRQGVGWVGRPVVRVRLHMSHT
jgi:MFS superfamily sulfate permease-like transporter